MFPSTKVVIWSLKNFVVVVSFLGRNGTLHVGILLVGTRSKTETSMCLVTLSGVLLVNETWYVTRFSKCMHWSKDELLPCFIITRVKRLLL